jgi:hypothetical protein
MKALTRYMDHINLRRAMLGRAPLDVYSDYVELRMEIEALGSPEILSGDGEYPLAESRRRTDEWIDAMRELDRIEQELTA